MLRRTTVTLTFTLLLSSCALASTLNKRIEDAAKSQSFPFDDRCTPAGWHCREASIKQNEPVTHPLLMETVPRLAEVLGLDPQLRYRNIDLSFPNFAAIFYELVSKYPCVLPLWGRKDAEQNVRALLRRCEPAYDHKLHPPAKVNGDRNLCYLTDLKERLQCGEEVCFKLRRC